MQIEVFVAQSGRFGSSDDRIAGQTRKRGKLIPPDRILGIVCMRTVWAEREVPPEMMKRAHRVIQFVVVEQCQLIVNLGATRAVIERGLVQVDCPPKVALRCFAIGILNELIVARRKQAIAPDEAEGQKNRQPIEPRLVGARHRRQFAQL